jgi:hypothetical protein
MGHVRNAQSSGYSMGLARDGPQPHCADPGATPHGRGKRNKLRVIGLNPFGGAVILVIPPGIAKAPLFLHRKGERHANVSSRFAFPCSGVGGSRSGLRPLARSTSPARDRVAAVRPVDLRPAAAARPLLKTTEVYLKYLTPEEQQRVEGLSTSSRNRHKDGTGINDERH